MKRSDLVVGAFIVALSLLVFVEAGTYATRGVQIEYFGPAFFPRILCIVLIFCAILQVVAALMGKSLHKTEHIDRIGFGRMAAAFGLAIVYWATIEWTGFIVATPVFLFLLMTLMGARDFAHRVGVSIAGPFAIWLLFERLLVIDLPQGAILYALFGE